jgi:hypothetical protein
LEEDADLQFCPLWELLARFFLPTSSAASACSGDGPVDDWKVGTVTTALFLDSRYIGRHCAFIINKMPYKKKLWRPPSRKADEESPRKRKACRILHLSTVDVANNTCQEPHFQYKYPYYSI